MKEQFSIEISGMIDDELLPDIFYNLNKTQRELFKEEKIYITFNNNNIARDTLDKLLKIPNIIVLEKTLDSDYKKVGTLIQPYPKNQKIYDIVSIYTKSDNTTKKQDFIIDKQEDINYSFENSYFCKNCQKSTAKELDLCIFCGDYIDNNNSLENFSIKIDKIKELDTSMSLAKLVCKESKNNDFKIVLDHFIKLPTIFNFSCNLDYFKNLCNLLNKYSITYSILDNSSFDIKKIFYTFKPYGTLNIGILSNKSYLDPILTKLSSDLLKELSFENLKKSFTNFLYEIYTIINIFRKNEDFSIYLDIEKNLEELLKKYFLLIRKSQELNNYLNEHSLDKINKEIKDLYNKKENTINIEIIKTYDEIIYIKEREYNEFLSIEKYLEVLKSQIISVSTLLRAMRTKIIYLNNSPIMKNKKENTEINNIKENLVLKINSIQEVLNI